MFFPEVPTSSNWRAAARLSDAAAKIACAAAAVLGLERGSQSWRRTRWTSPYQKYDQENTLYSHFTDLKNISHLPHKTVSKSSTSINFHSRNTRSSLSVCAVSSSTTSTVGGMLPSVDPSRSSWKPNDSTEGILVANHLNEMIEISNMYIDYIVMMEMLVLPKPKPWPPCLATWINFLGQILSKSPIQSSKQNVWQKRQEKLPESPKLHTHI